MILLVFYKLKVFCLFCSFNILSVYLQVAPPCPQFFCGLLSYAIIVMFFKNPPPSLCSFNTVIPVEYTQIPKNTKKIHRGKFLTFTRRPPFELDFKTLLTKQGN